jgi:nicotinic acid mononucleotide adenylyltransferase
MINLLQETNGYIVLAGWISPSHEIYVGSKCRRFRTKHIPANHRIECVRLAVKNEPWLSVSTLETSTKGHWLDFPEITSRLGSYMATLLPTEMPVTPFYVCGSDHFNNCGLTRGLEVKRCGVVGVYREGEPLPRTKLAKEVFIAVNDQVELQSAALSSTLVRNAFDEHRVDCSMVPQNVIDYLQPLWYTF